MKVKAYLAAAAVLGAVSIQPGHAGTFSDSLTNGIDPTYWTISQNPDPSTYFDSNGATGETFQTNPGNSSSIESIGLSLNLAALGGAVTGDFTTQVSFQDAVVNGGGLDQIELHTQFGNGDIFFDSLSQQGSSGNVHVWTGSVNGGINGTPTSGTFAISSVGGTLSGYFDGTLIFSEAESSDLTSVAFLLQNNAGSSDATAVTFNDFSITADSIPEPSSLAVLGVGLIGLATRARRKASRPPAG
jgi:hypothetical protein